MTPKSYLRRAGYAYRVFAVCCIGLLFLTGLTAAVHFHDSARLDHPCSVCVHVHAGIAHVEIASAVPFLAPSVLLEPPAAHFHSPLLITFHCIRPPPQA